MSRRLAAACLAGSVLLALAVRSIGWERVFPGDGTVVFALGDAYYHARRAFVAFERFPNVLLFDPLLNHPNGAFVPWPPLYDLTLAAVARAFGSTQAVFERVAALLPAVLGALTVLPVYASGRIVASRAAGVAAAALFAVLPATVLYSNVGNADHHAAQALAGATVLALSLRAVSEPARASGRVGRAFAGLAVARAALLLTWPGSLVYLLLAEGSLLAAGVLSGRRDLLAGEAASALASALLVLPVVAVSGTPVGGLYSAIELSRLHVLLLGVVSAGALVLLSAEHVRPSGGPGARIARAAVVFGALGVAIVAATGVLRELALGLGYVAKTDAYEGRNLEQFPLFSLTPRFSDAVGRETFGFLAWLVPFAPLSPLLRARDPERRMPLLLLAAWSAALGVLALLQVRFGNDYAPVGSVALVLLLADLSSRFTPRATPRRRALLATAAALVLLLPVIEAQGRAAAASLGALGAGASAGDRALLSYEGTMLRFAQQVRAATPETAGFDDPSKRPEYGILSYPGIGHVLHYVARRATPADNFGPYIGPENYEAVGRFFGLRTETAALDEAARLGTPYVLTTDYGGSAPHTLVNRLHLGDGRTAAGSPPLVHFRLVTEGPAGGRAIGERFGGRTPGGAPYKLFELVPGALVEARGEPGTPMAVEVTVRTDLGRRFPWRVETVVGKDGVGLLRVPYATDAGTPTRPEGAARVTLGERTVEIPIPDAAVRAGDRVSVLRSAP